MVVVRRNKQRPANQSTRGRVINRDNRVSELSSISGQPGTTALLFIATTSSLY